MTVIKTVTEHINLSESKWLGILTVPDTTTPNIEQVKTMMANSEIIDFGLQLLTAPIRAINHTYESDDPRSIEYLEEFFRPFVYDLQGKVHKALEFGFSPMVKWYDYNGQYIIPNAFKSYDVANITLYPDEEGNYGGLDNGMTQVEAGATVLAIWNREWDDAQYMYGRSILQQAYNHFYTQSLLTVMYNRYFEQQGTPLFLVWYPMGANKTETDANKDKAEAAAKNLRVNSYMLMPFDENTEPERQPYRVETLDFNTDGSNFLARLQDLDRRMFFSLFIPESYIDDRGGQGSFARSIQRSGVVKQTLEEIARFDEDVINRQIIDQLMEWNGLGEAKINFEPIIDENVAMIDTYLTAVAQGKTNDPALVAMGREMLAEMVNKKIEDFEVEEPVQVSVPGIEEDIEKEVKAELENRPQPKTFDEAKAIFEPAAAKAFELAKKDYSAGRKKYRVALHKYIRTSWVIGANKGYTQMDNAEDADGNKVKVSYTKAPVDTVWINKRERGVTNKAWDNLKNDSYFIKLENREAVDIRLQQNVDLFAANHIPITATTEFQEASNEGFAAAMAGVK